MLDKVQNEAFVIMINGVDDSKRVGTHSLNTHENGFHLIDYVCFFLIPKPIHLDSELKENRGKDSFD